MFPRCVGAHSLKLQSYLRQASSTALKYSRCGEFADAPTVAAIPRSSCQRRYLSRPPRKQYLEKMASRKIAPPARNNDSNSSSKKGNYNKKLSLVAANAVLFCGMSMWLLIFVDRYFKDRERECIQKAHEQLYADFGDLDELADRYKTHPALGQCIVRLRSRELKQLYPIQVGEVVDVLVEGVGRDGTLNICRTRPQNPMEQPMVCLYPMGCLQRVQLVEDYNDDKEQDSNTQSSLK